MNARETAEAILASDEIHCCHLYDDASAYPSWQLADLQSLAKLYLLLPEIRAAMTEAKSVLETEGFDDLLEKLDAIGEE